MARGPHRRPLYMFRASRLVLGTAPRKLPDMEAPESATRRWPLDCICNGGFRPFSRFASGHLPYSVDLLRPALCLPLRISLRNLVYEVTSTSDGCLIFFEGTRRRRGCAEAGGRGRGNILLAELQIHSNPHHLLLSFTESGGRQMTGSQK